MYKTLLITAMTLAATLAAETKVLVISGSTRENSFNKKLAHEAASIATRLGASVSVIDLRDFPMPFYDGDIEEQRGMPATAVQFRNLLKKSNAVIIATPEYNGAVSAVLKNALDWASRSEDGKPSQDAFKGKRVAIMSTSPGSQGGKRALENLRIIVETIGGKVVDIRLSVPDAYNAFNQEGKLKNPELNELLKQEVQQLLQ